MNGRIVDDREAIDGKTSRSICDAVGERLQQSLRPELLAPSARLQRLRSGLGLNYAALGLVVDLLDRVATLEAALRQRSAHAPLKQTTGGRPWT